jgi:hypothetical protein
MQNAAPWIPAFAGMTALGGEIIQTQMDVIPAKERVKKSAFCFPTRHCEERSDEAIQGQGALPMPSAGLPRPSPGQAFACGSQ